MSSFPYPAFTPSSSNSSTTSSNTTSAAPPPPNFQFSPFPNFGLTATQAMQSGKRQRRQAGALLVQSLWSSGNKKAPAAAPAAASTSNPKTNSSAKNNRPLLEVPPMGFGPIREPNGNDVLCGRGGLINGSAGNVQFRNIVSKRKKEYNSKATKRHEKAHLAAEIVRQIRSMNPPGRFLREDANGLWFDIGDARAIRKTGQALREAAPSIRQELEGDGEKAAESGSDDGKNETKTPSGQSTEDTSKRNNSESPKRKNQEADDSQKKKEGKAKKEATKKSTKKVAAASQAESSPVPASDASVMSSATTKSKRSSWLPGRGSRTSTDSPSVTADNTRSSQSFLIPTAALGPHITGSMAIPAGAMPRMSGGAVFSNSGRGGGVRSSAPPALAPDQHYQQIAQQHAHHPHLYPYPYAHPHPPHMHPMMPPPPHHPHHQAMHPHHLHPSHPPVPMQHPSYHHPIGYSEDAFGMNFFPTNDVTMETGSCTVSDISGLSSSVTGDVRKHKDKRQKPTKHQPTSELEGVPPMLPPAAAGAHPGKPGSNNNLPHGSPAMVAQNHDNTANNARVPPAAVMPPPVDDASMPIDTSSSLPSFSDILDDVDMASATSGKGSSLAMASVSSSSVAKLLAPAPMATNTSNTANNSGNNNNAMMPPAAVSQSYTTNKSKRNVSTKAQFLNQPPPSMKENSNSTGSCLSGKSGSLLSGKSEISLPSSCGTNISQFSDTFMAMHLSEPHGYE